MSTPSPSIESNMTLDELTQLVTARQMILTRHDREMAGMNANLAKANESIARANESIASANATLDRVAAETEASMRRHAEMDRKAALNQEAIANLNASIQELRNIVSDYIQGRS
ncbi:MAG: hypothetical protein VKL39_14550 [Leptolyngbyaceae bacterium]|nr:hypothetical protein [Leptolyngbyaceae bacterium]